MDETKLISILLLIFSFVLFNCGTEYKSLDSDNGRQAIIDEANNHLSAGQCGEAITLLSPLYSSQYNNNEIRTLYSSAYACKAGFNFLSLIINFKDISGNDIWSPIIKSNYSASSSDEKVTNLQTSAAILRQTSSVTDTTSVDYYDAQYRPENANMYMIFIQASIVALTISTTSMGNANSETGKKGSSIAGLGTTDEKCRIAIAIATINNALDYVSSGSAINKLSDSISNVCGGSCPTTKNPATCTSTEQTQGDALILTIDSQWST